MSRKRADKQAQSIAADGTLWLACRFGFQDTLEIVAGDGIIGIEPQGGSQVGFRCLQVSLIHVHEAQITLGQVAVWIEALDRLEFSDSVAKAMPFLKERFPTHRSYSQAGVDDLLGDKKPQTHELRATTLTSMIFFNRGGHFEAVPLPAEAQLSAVFSLNVADIDGDGNEDVFLSQNFFATQPGTPRLDAGRGLWLRGDGTGKLTPIPAQQSGIKVYGEQRGAALCDYDGDGRVDLVVTQNGAETKLYRNVGARPGLRVRLEGPAGNPSGIGAQVRLIFGQRQGPVREIHAGSGYWSQDSAVQVMAAPEPPKQIQVHWPGGKTTLSPVPLGGKEIVVDTAGVVKPLR